MGRIRTTKPEFWESTTIAQVDFMARLLFQSIWTHADDHGHFNAHPTVLRTGAFMHDNPDGEGAEHVTDDDVREARDSLARLSLVGLYKVNGKMYGKVLNWQEHQRVDHPGKARYPQDGEPYHPDDPNPTNGSNRLFDEPDVEPSRHPREDLATPSRDPRDTLAPDLGPRTIGDLHLTTFGAPAENPGGATADVVELKPKRPDQIMFDVLLDELGWAYSDVTDQARGPLNTAIRQLLAAGATPDETRRRCALHRQRFDFRLTPTSLAKNWAELGRATPQPVARGDERRYGRGRTTRQILDAAVEAQRDDSRGNGSSRAGDGVLPPARARGRDSAVVGE